MTGGKMNDDSSKKGHPQEKAVLLIVEDDEDLRTQMKWALAGDYGVLLAEDRQTALEKVRSERPAVMTLDLGLPPAPAGVEEGFQTLSEILMEDPDVKVIIITGRGEKEYALRAVGMGAYDYFFKPIGIDELKVVLKRAFHISGLEREQRELRKSQFLKGGFEGMLGTCGKMMDVYAMIRKVSPSDIPVLITGESGTGKELVARAIHRLSPKSVGPFVVINCGAIPENLLESELFGHEKGAFTGAHTQRKGRFELAHKGTLFLDEIGDLSLQLQVKLLRFLQDNIIERIGGRHPIPVDVRIVAATNRDLKEGMSQGTFREDLYFRLGVVTLSLPPLKDREGDILLLAKAFADHFAGEYKKKITGFTEKAAKALESHSWPGNIRELENRIKRAVIMAEGKKIEPRDLELEEAGLGAVQAVTLKEAREDLEKELVLQAISRNGGNLSKAAADLGISRPTLYDLLEKHGISKNR